MSRRNRGQNWRYVTRTDPDGTKRKALVPYDRNGCEDKGPPAKPGRRAAPGDREKPGDRFRPHGGTR